MLNSILKYKDQLTTNCFKMKNPRFNKTISQFNFYLIIQGDDYQDEICKKINRSKVIIIDEFEELNEKYMIICFDFTLILIPLKHFFNLYNFFKNCDSSIIIFQSSVKETLDNVLNKDFSSKYSNTTDIAHFYFYPIENKFINSLSNAINTINPDFQSMWDVFKKSISAYLFMRNFVGEKDERFFDYENFFKNKEIEMKKDDFINLFILDTGSSSIIKLIYHFEKEQFLVLKCLTNENRSESLKLFNREKNNYKKFRHPYLLKYYGEIKMNDQNCLILEYIDGNSLYDINNLNIRIEDKILIILKILIVFDYFHFNKCIYRDLKPDNIILNCVKTPIIIDLGRLIEIKENNSENTEKKTANFFSNFVPPEIQSTDKISLKYDVYCIGLLIIFILIEREPIVNINFEESKVVLEDQNIFNNLPKKYLKIKEICENCILFDPQKRPDVAKILDDFYYMIYSDIPKRLSEIQEIRSMEKIQSKKFLNYWVLISDPCFHYTFKLALLYLNEGVLKNSEKAIYYLESLAKDDSYIQNFLGMIFIEGEYVQQNINKALYYFKLSANQGNLIAQYNLGLICYEGKYVQRDLNKSKYFLTLSANQNFRDAQCLLGVFYYEIDIHKSIYYLTLAANQNYAQAQLYLGFIYIENKHFKDINKGLYYVKLSSDQNYIDAQEYLGYLYYNFPYITRDINKSLYYLELSASQGYPKSLCLLGQIYYEGIYVKQDINKAMNYFTLSANQMNKESLAMLGIIYYEGQYVEQNINKAINSFTLAANLDDETAQYYLGVIYYEGKHVEKNIDKTIYYLTLSSEKDKTISQFCLGILYYELENIVKSIEYLKMAAEKFHDDSNYKLGCIYFENKYVPRDIIKAIHYYSNSSSFYNEYAKNNLGIIYKRGIGGIQNIKYAKVLFKEAINLKNDELSMYNLVHLYFFQQRDHFNYKKCLNLLLKSSKILGNHSFYLICLIFVDKYKIITLELIENDLENQSFINPITLLQMIKDNHFERNYDHNYQILKEVDFVYDIDYQLLEYSSFQSQKQIETNQKKSIPNISKDFYEGFYDKKF